MNTDPSVVRSVTPKPIQRRIDLLFVRAIQAM